MLPYAPKQWLKIHYVAYQNKRFWLKIAYSNKLFEIIFGYLGKFLYFCSEKNINKVSINHSIKLPIFPTHISLLMIWNIP